MEDREATARNNGEEEFIIRFALRDVASDVNGKDPLVEMIRLFLVDVQNIGFLCCQGKRVSIDGFVLNNDPERVHPLAVEGDGR